MANTVAEDAMSREVGKLIFVNQETGHGGFLTNVHYGNAIDYNGEWYCKNCMGYHDHDNTDEVILKPSTTKPHLKAKIVVSRNQWTYILEDLRK